MKKVIASIVMSFSTSAFAEEIKCNIRSTYSDTRIQVKDEASQLLKLRKNSSNEGVWVVCNEGEANAKFKGEVFFASGKIMKDFRTQFIEYNDGTRIAGRDSSCDANISIKIQRHKAIVEGLSFKVVDYCKAYKAKIVADAAAEKSKKAKEDAENAKWEADVNAWIAENQAAISKTDKWQEIMKEVEDEAKVLSSADEEYVKKELKALGRKLIKEKFATEIAEWIAKRNK